MSSWERSSPTWGGRDHLARTRKGISPHISPLSLGQSVKSQSGRQDSNLRPSAPKATETYAHWSAPFCSKTRSTALVLVISALLGLQCQGWIDPRCSPLLRPVQPLSNRCPTGDQPLPCFNQLGTAGEGPSPPAPSVALQHRPRQDRPCTSATAFCAD